LYNIEEIKNTILQGNCLSVLKSIPDNSINMIFTSPPYWGLRNYGGIPEIWGGDKNHDHVWTDFTRKGISGGIKSKKVQIKDESNFQIVPDSNQSFCFCGAWKGELGQEPNYKYFIIHLVEIFNECRRVLTDNGSLWVNLGDSYLSTSIDSSCRKSLVGIPDRFKITMIDNQWICRNDIIWYKRNAMPSSVADRFSVDYERIFFFTKNEKYYFDQQKEPCINGDPASPRGSKGTKTPNSGRRNKQNELGKATYTGFNARYEPRTERNIRSVWDIPVQPFRGAHFATFPKNLLKTPILSGCPENGIVMDIFFGSGTVGLVAKELNRNFLGIELNEKYIEIAKERLGQNNHAN
jgi:site-specific DNA-methyltransferase (adenine-specific)